MTTLFEPKTGPRVFALPPGINFSQALVEGLDNRLAGQPPEAIARVTIWVNSQRAKRTLESLYLQGKPTLWPRIRVVTDLDTDPLAPLDLPAHTPKLQRKIDLARLIQALTKAESGLIADTTAFDLAESLSALLGELQGEAIDPIALQQIDAEEHAEHWKQSLRFLQLLENFARKTGSEDSQGRQRAVADAWLSHWESTPTVDPVIVAGSTGSRAPTRAFMAAVVRLPQGAVILPGFDDELPSDVWTKLQAETVGNPDHPQYGLAKLLQTLGIEIDDVDRWTTVEPPNRDRNALISLAMRPAPVTDQWLTQGQAMKPRVETALADVTWIDAPDTRSEARAIAWVLREAAENRKKAALVTSDRTLARRVANELDRWRLVPDDSAGRPLPLTPPGILLRITAELIGAEITAVALLALLKHPLTNSHEGARGPHIKLTERLETEMLRGGDPIVNWTKLNDWAVKRGDDTAEQWIAWVQRSISPLAIPIAAPLDEYARIHKFAVEALSDGHSDTGTGRIWEKDAGQSALSLMECLIHETSAYGEALPAEYRSLLMSEMSSRDVPEQAVVTNPDIAVWGTLEARIQSPEILILGGLNEGIWPKQPPADPWLNRRMRQQLGLPSPERQIGLSAHDFQQAIAARKVVLTRSKRNSEAPTVPSRWLMRLENLVNGLGDEAKAALSGAQARGDIILELATMLDQPKSSIAAAVRPSPRPPIESRPSDLSVTQVETLVRDPYSIYARKVLKLRPLDPPGKEPDPLMRGNVVHRVLEIFVQETTATWPEHPHSVFTNSIETALAELVPWPSVRAIWSARLARSVTWFIEGEYIRRTISKPTRQEVWGRMEVMGTDRPFEITAKADRIDQLTGGGYAIYDYKSGNIPSEKEVRAFHLQLPLEGAIAESGGFKDLPAAPAHHLELLGLGSRANRVIETGPESTAETLAQLLKLIGYYQQPENGFTARLRPQRITFESDYDHLSRRGEWSDSDAPGVPR